jgi:membrane-bound serine protease (ClpP class)
LAFAGKRIAVFVWLFFLILGGSLSGIAWTSDAKASAVESGTSAAGGYVYVIPVQMTVQEGLYSFLDRALSEAEDAGAALAVLNIDTPGGRLDTAETIAKRIRESQVPTLAYVSGKAASAGAYLALNAGGIVMSPGSTIGAAMIVDQSGNAVDNPKIVGHWRSEMIAAAELNGRNPDIAVAMIDPDVELELKEINRSKTKGQILSLSAQEALALGYADHIAKTVDEAIAWKGLSGLTVVELNPTFAERAAQWLTNPVIATVLLILGIAGIAIEFFVPGFGVPGIIGLLAFGLYFFGSYIAGFAGMESIIFFLAGVILLVIEMFVPSFGILGILGIIGIIIGIANAAYDTGDAMKSLGIAALVALVIIIVVAYVFRKRGIWNKFILKEQLTKEQGFIPNESREMWIGKVGTTLTQLRPAGVALIDGERVDVVSMGEFIDKDVKVRVTHADGTRIVVQEISDR